MSAAKPSVRLGVCSWTAKGWLGTFYPEGTKQAEFIAHYAKHFDSVEIDSTFYGIPRRSTVEGWAARTPEDFVFACKAPQTITHEKFMEDCEDDLAQFLDTMRLLGPRLGPVLFQFPYFAKRRGVSLDDFVGRLAPFLDTLPKDGQRFAVEVRNKQWITPALCDLLRHHGVALTVIDHPWMSRPGQLMRGDIFTADFTYIRWLGDRHGIEKITKVWNEQVVERERDLEDWMHVIQAALSKNVDVFGYVNNHYSGYAVPDVEMLRDKLSQD